MAVQMERVLSGVWSRSAQAAEILQVEPTKVIHYNFNNAVFLQDEWVYEFSIN